MEFYSRKFLKLFSRTVESSVKSPCFKFKHHVDLFIWTVSEMRNFFQFFVEQWIDHFHLNFVGDWLADSVNYSQWCMCWCTLYCLWHGAWLSFPCFFWYVMSEFIYAFCRKFSGKFFNYCSGWHCKNSDSLKSSHVELCFMNK